MSPLRTRLFAEAPKAPVAARVRDRAQARHGLLERARGLPARRPEQLGPGRVGGRRRRAAAAGERGARRRVLRVHQPERVRARAERRAAFRGVEVSFDVARVSASAVAVRARRLEKKQRAEGKLAWGRASR